MIGVKRVALACALVFSFSSCALMGETISFFDEDGDPVETTVGDVTADAVEAVGTTIGSVANGAVTMASGNPVFGAAAAAALAALVAGASRKLRKKKPADPPE